MNKAASLFKPLMPILSAVYGLGVIYITALPVDGNHPTFVGEMLTWLITLAGIAMTLCLVQYVEPKVFPAAEQFPLKFPTISVILGLLLIAPLWLVAEGYIVYGVTSLAQPVMMAPLTYTTEELLEDLLSSIHAVLLAPLLEELCFRQMAISPFRSRGAQVVVCVVMALLFGILHVRNFPGAFLSALVYGGVFIWSRNIWYSVILHAGRNLAENEIRPITLGRKNYLFCGNHEAAANMCIVNSLLATCRNHDVNPRLYLNDIISKMPYMTKATHEELVELLPHRWKLKHQDAIMTRLREEV